MISDSGKNSTSVLIKANIVQDPCQSLDGEKKKKKNFKEELTAVVAKETCCTVIQVINQ